MHTYFRKNQKILPNIHNSTHLKFLILVSPAPDPVLGTYHYPAKVGALWSACHRPATEGVTPILRGLKQQIFTVSFILHVVCFLLTHLLAKINLNLPKQYQSAFTATCRPLQSSPKPDAPRPHSRPPGGPSQAPSLPSYSSSHIVNKYPLLHVVPRFPPFLCPLLVISLFKKAP